MARTKWKQNIEPPKPKFEWQFGSLGVTHRCYMFAPFGIFKLVIAQGYNDQKDVYHAFINGHDVGNITASSPFAAAKILEQYFVDQLAMALHRARKEYGYDVRG